MNLFDTRCTFYTDIDHINTHAVVDTEVMPCAAWEEDGKILYDAEAGSNDVWSVYLRMDMTIAEDNPSRCIADFETVEQALRFEKLVRLLLKLDV